MSIAIVGMACRFADAPNLHAYWALTVEGRQAFAPVPADRWDSTAFFDSNKRANDKSYAPTGAWIDDIRSFPGLALGIPPRRLEVMDPQQRLALETALHAIHDAGRRPADMPRRTGVYMGVTANEFRMLVGSRVLAQILATGQLGVATEDPAALAAAVERVVPARPYSAPGVLSNMIAAAIAQELDLHGPAYTVDAACASALVAVHDAVLHLRAGTVDAAVAGGVYLCLTPENHIAFSRIGAISASGNCRPFDARADGFVQGDGVGVVVLKRLADAERDGDRIYAVIHGVATNNDGRGDGPMAPVEAGQGDVIADAWREAKIDPDLLGYVETHGTGTEVGDATEFRSLCATLGAQFDEGEFGKVALGSSKGNIGHTMSAAGVAGLIRAALSIHHGTLPPMAGFESSKDQLGLAESAFHIATEAAPWPHPRRVAAVSSFGFGGTNSHVVLAGPDGDYGSPVALPELVPLSAPDERSLRHLAGITADALLRQPAATVSGVARAWAVRPIGAVRLGLVAGTVGELVDQLRRVAAGETPKGCWLGTPPEEPPKLAFLFPGQGAQRVGMLRGIARRFPIVAASLAEAESDLGDVLDLPLTQLLWPDLRETEVSEATASEELTATENCQPAVAAAGIALAALLGTAGIRPVVVAGHSLGEFVAYVVAGAASPRDVLRFTAARGRAMADTGGDPGAMIALMTDAETARGLLVDGAVIANHNHPTQMVVSGTTDAIEAVATRAATQGVRARRLEVSHAFHSPKFANLDVEGALEAVALADPLIPVASAITGGAVTSAGQVADVFRRHAGSPVDFVRALGACEAAGAELFLQVGAGGPLASFARGMVPKDHVFSLAQADDDDRGRTLLEGIAWLWARGVSVDFAAIHAEASVVSVPPVVLPREVYWPVKEGKQIALAVSRGSGAGHSPTVEAPQAAPANVEVLDPVAEAVLGVVAKVSAYPRAAVSPKQGLVGDLGFDSLMIADLAAGIAEAFPGIGGIPQELLVERPTVGAIIDWARTARSGAASPDDDDAPLSAWTPVWRIAALPDAAANVAGRRVAVEGVGPWVTALRTGLAGAGAVLSDEPEILVWACDAADPVHPAAVVAGEGAIPDPAAPLLARLDALALQAGAVDLLLVRRAEDPWAEAATGAVRAVAREWPDRVVKSVAFDSRISPTDLVARLIAEHASEDRTIDVRWTSTSRAVLGLEPTVSEAAEPIGPDDVVLITGGTRGIGARLAERAVVAGARVVLVGRSAPGAEAEALIASGSAVHLAVDVLDRAALIEAVRPHGVTALVHAAGILADGPLGAVDASLGKQARLLKIAGWLNALAAAPGVRVALALGSWAGRFGNRHQAHYAAGNAGMAALAASWTRGRAVVSEFGPWTSSEMVRSIPGAVQAAMRAEGVDFAGDRAGLDAVWDALASGRGVQIHGRTLPWTTRARRHTEVLSVETHPFLADHVIAGVPVLPLAAAADAIAFVAGIATPFEILDLTLFSGVAVRGPTPVEVTVRGERAEIRVGARRQLAYRARIRPLLDEVSPPAPATGGDPSPLPLTAFYGPVAFHGPLLQGLTHVDGVARSFARGRVVSGTPGAWIPTSPRKAWSVDPLALDSAMQLSGVAIWVRDHRSGTPIGVRRLVCLAPLPAGEVVAEAHFSPTPGGDRFVCTLVLRDTRGKLLMLAEDTAVELRGQPDAPAAEPQRVLKPEWTNPALWPAVQDLKIRLEMAEAVGMRNPYFAVHEGTARNTTVVGGRTLVNFSSYNYIGLSGDSRVVEATCEAVHRYGTSVSASRVASGERPFHHELERELAAAQGAEAALVFTAGHATNVTTIGHLFGKGDLILHDEFIHDSALQGIKLSGAARRGFRHDDPAHLEQLLIELRGHHEKCLIIVEGVYSMDGDIPDVPSVLALKKKYGCMLMIDEAHSFGVIGATGRGIGEHYGIDGREVDLWMGTLSKSLASCGGWIAASEAVITYLRYTAPGFVYSAGLTAANGVAALTALRLMLEEPWRVAHLQSNAKVFWQALRDRGVDTGPAKGGSGVVPAITGNSLWALQLSGRLLEAGVNVQPIVYPAVADDASRLRFFLSSTHTEEELVSSATKVADLLASVKADFPMPGR